MEIELDLSDFDPDFDQVLELEARTGKALDKMSAMEQTRGFVYLAMKDKNPDFTWEESGKIKISALAKVDMPVPLDGTGENG